MKKQIRARAPRRGVHQLAMRALAEVAGGADASAAYEPYRTFAEDALTYDPYRKFKFLGSWVAVAAARER